MGTRRTGVVYMAVARCGTIDARPDECANHCSTNSGCHRRIFGCAAQFVFTQMNAVAQAALPRRGANAQPACARAWKRLLPRAQRRRGRPRRRVIACLLRVRHGRVFVIRPHLRVRVIPLVVRVVVQWQHAAGRLQQRARRGELLQLRGRALRERRKARGPS